MKTKNTDKIQVLNQVSDTLSFLAERHPHGLMSIGSANAHEVLTRFGIDGEVAEIVSTCFEVLEDHEAVDIEAIVNMLDTQLQTNGKLNEPVGYDCAGVKPGEKDANGLYTHPQLTFTAVNYNGRHYGIEADASLKKGLPYYQDWRDADEIQNSGIRIISLWDATEGRFWDGFEIANKFTHASHN